MFFLDSGSLSPNISQSQQITVVDSSYSGDSISTSGARLLLLKSYDVQ